MKIAAALVLAQNKLQQSNINSAAIDSLALLCYSTGFSKEEAIFNPNLELTKKQLDDFWSAIARRQRREPVSHILSRREFYGLDFFVSRDVLDPRPDSESLIELIQEIFLDKNQKLEFLELGVGSGCLSISLLKNFSNAAANGVDISLAALEIAQKNANIHQVQNRFQLKKSDLFAAIEAKKFDLIISNPPYIEAAQIENLADEVRLFEPRLALDGGIDGLDFYRRIAKESANFLKPAGFVAVEVGHDQAQKVVEIFAQYQLGLKKIKRDLAGVDRALCFVR
jgi:release factor glutamine methyltransferase